MSGKYLPGGLGISPGAANDSPAVLDHRATSGPEMSQKTVGWRLPSRPRKTTSRTTFRGGGGSTDRRAPREEVEGVEGGLDAPHGRHRGGPVLCHQVPRLPAPDPTQGTTGGGLFLKACFLV